jgi:hypothetical protein
MMERRNQGQGQLFYEFRLDEAVPDDHLVRKIGALLDLSWVYAELAPYYSEIGATFDRPGADDPDVDHRLERDVFRSVRIRNQRSSLSTRLV